MKQDTKFYIIGFIGALVSYPIGIANKAETWELLTNAFLGFFIFFQLARAVSYKFYTVIVGLLIGLALSIFSDLLAGSEISLEQKFMYMSMGLFIGWPWTIFKKSIMLGGIIGSGIGFIWGWNAGHWFGNVFLEPGLLNAALMAVQVALIGMCAARMTAEFAHQAAFKKQNVSPQERRK